MSATVIPAGIDGYQMTATAARDTVGCGHCKRPVQIKVTTDGNGRLVEHIESCQWCARKRAGLCQRCHTSPVNGRVGMALRCALCNAIVIRERQLERARRKQDPWKREGICMDCRKAPVYGKVGWAETCGPCRDARKRESMRRTYRRDPAKLAAKNAYKREWRRQNPDKVRLQKRRAALRSGGTASDWQARYREEVAAGIRQPKRAPRNLRGERLCLTPDCHAAMTGRAKKCDPCKGYTPKQEAQNAA